MMRKEIKNIKAATMSTKCARWDTCLIFSAVFRALSLNVVSFWFFFVLFFIHCKSKWFSISTGVCVSPRDGYCTLKRRKGKLIRRWKKKKKIKQPPRIRDNSHEMWHSLNAGDLFLYYFHGVWMGYCEAGECVIKDKQG